MKSNLGKGVVAITVPEPRLLTIKQASTYLACTVWAVRSLVWGRHVPHVVIGRRILFDKADLDHFVDTQKSAVAR